MLFIVCALNCEALPLISHFRLKRISVPSPFPIYIAHSIYLIISGIGKVQTAAAMGYLQALTGHLAHTAWLNVGIAGHLSYPLGTGVLAHQIIDQANGKRYYPVFVIQRPVPTASIWTVDKPEKQYGNEQAVYEMEASAFWSIASRFTTAELIHCYKVISDNQIDSACSLTQNKVEQLIKGNLSHIDLLVRELQALSQSLLKLELPKEEIDRFLQHWHFTSTQQIQLKHLLQRWRACTSQPFSDLWDSQLLAQTKSQHVLRDLETRLRALSFHLTT